MSLLEKKTYKEKIALGFSTVRSLHYTLQGLLLPFVELAATGNKRASPKNHLKNLKQISPKVQQLFARDSKNISDGIYPSEVLYPQDFFGHVFRIPWLYVDAFKTAKRRQLKESKVFNAEASEFLQDVPEYYRRNFHFQSNGYLSLDSAELYEQQVEVLFSGTGDAMRRLILPPMKKHFEMSDGTGLHFLEIGCGTGSLTRSIALAFPNARITCVDLSSFYLKKAQQRLSQFNRIDYWQGAGEDLPFKAETYDAVFSCFLFHELPHEIRMKMITEGKRLLKKNGLFGVVDSLQLNDDADLDWALELFPVDFHEPFYKDYTVRPLPSLLEKGGFDSVCTECGFLSKVVTGVKA